MFLTKNTRKKAVVVFIIIAALIFGYQIFFKKNKTDLVLFNVVKGDVTQEVSETGQVQKGEEIDLNFKTAGRIESVSIRAGDKVISGQELARMDTQQLQIQLGEAQSALNVIEAKRDDANLSLDAARQELADTIATQNEKVDKEYKDAITVVDDVYLNAYNAFAFMDLLKRTYFTSYPTQESGKIFDNVFEIEKVIGVIEVHVDEIKKGFDKEKINSALDELGDEIIAVRNQLEQARITIETSSYRSIVSNTDKSSLDAHKSNINGVYSDFVAAKADISLAEVIAQAAINSAESTVYSLENQLDVDRDGLYESQVNEARLRVRLLAEQIEDATLKSPVDGQVARVNKKAGETAQPADLEPVISVLPLIPFEVETDIYEEDVVKINVGNPVDISLVPFPDKIFAGMVVAIDPAEKIIDGVIYYEVNIVFVDDVPQNLKPGMTADVNIRTGLREGVIIIPEEALSSDNGKKTVQVMKNRKIEEREIRVGLEGSDGMVEVLSGLQEGEKVVIRQ
ncbi:MAG: hypothetical protein A3H01_00335 [Candidatus Wildermuthbacteria bacterium RIFCSPLOWO2_12_FULL_40_9]|uniref:Multidrug resistance protein MdtA-like C-terminal permuted SH3 domain-containing protein n=2 Tax=Candidatus Wildermuthiibacteriota TaxID=1817923 RepID=A0A1G2RE60_9BACT|nr:MAG: hypothetical protein A3F15_02800 [Candidatus Wildermuthbacteria bacterium RIFCSPHIGHO2_12_FULL_40_12]OHA76270.1 MAG: hypothetical protein A3H01_00335 [Candidatus Wildermuthbacteria bacterium RIFCSPLOWO2_12_FULL_40_9]